jgi:hypothetical protein
MLAVPASGLIFDAANDGTLLTQENDESVVLRDEGQLAALSSWPSAAGVGEKAVLAYVQDYF